MTSIRTALDYAAMDESALMIRAGKGDHEAFHVIMQRCNQRLFRVARAVSGSDDEAEDILQDAYLRAFAGIGKFRGESSLLTWLTTITLNEARGRLRRRRPMVELTVMDNTRSRIIPFPGMTANADPEAETQRAETRRLLEAAVDSLPPDFRVVFVLREIEGCDVEETARQLDLKPQTVKTRLFRARRLLRQHLEQNFVSGLNGVFPFLGLRCAAICERVLARLP